MCGKFQTLSAQYYFRVVKNYIKVFIAYFIFNWFQNLFCVRCSWKCASACDATAYTTQCELWIVACKDKKKRTFAFLANTMHCVFNDMRIREILYLYYSAKQRVRCKLIFLYYYYYFYAPRCYDEKRLGKWMNALFCVKWMR